MSVRILALVEGQTEERFCNELIAPFLGNRGVHLQTTTMGRPRVTGGVKSWKQTEKELRRLLQEDGGRHVTTMFDYYGMPLDWPGRAAAARRPHGQKATEIENEMYARMEGIVGKHWRPDAFIPYVQLHEFEALLFAAPEVLGRVVSLGSQQDRAVRRFHQVMSRFGTPEEIDDGVSTAPSKRILEVAPGYQKVADGLVAASRIGLHEIRAACPNFNAWMERMESLGEP